MKDMDNDALDTNSNSRFNSVLSILNQCKTQMGKRFMNQIFLNPICRIEVLKERYDIIGHVMEQNYQFNEYLTQIKDLDKYMTKLKLGRLCPADIYHVNHALKMFDRMYALIKDDKKMKSVIKVEDCLETHDSLKSYFTSTFDMQYCQYIHSSSFDKYEQYNTKFIRKGTFPELDEQVKLKMESKDKLRVILDAIESLFDKKDDTKYIKEHQPSSSELCLILTKKRKALLQQKIQKLGKKKNILTLHFVSTYDNQEVQFQFHLNDLEFCDYNKTSCMLYSKEIDYLKSSIFNDNILLNVLNKCYEGILKTIYTKYYSHLDRVILFINQIDMYNNFVFLAKKYNLCKPVIRNKRSKNQKNQSYLNAKKMRHILIENIDNYETYVPNDIVLGSDSQLGVLLFGTNAVGKTSLIKSIGICVIMAQCGCYVPCESFVYYPYKYIFTRIIGNDNIFKGLSTFGVEMSELRVIINQCNENSLILGDELCSGTEIDSALAIFIASLQVMESRRSSFIFATHFHEIQKFKEISSMKNLQLKHLKVVYNHETDSLVYDRRLQNGCGESIYGLEVCKSLKMPPEFIDNCYAIRNNYIDNKNNVLLLKTSKYNKNKLKGTCEFVKKIWVLRFIILIIRKMQLTLITSTMHSTKTTVQI